MSFWGGEKIRSLGEKIFAPWDPEQIDCAAYTLKLGGEVFVTQEQDDTDPQSGVKIRLEREGDPVRIPAGQFGFLLTEEEVDIPSDAIGFISIKSTTKLRGLVNVSGFHVDPGYKGKLVFAVYNASPSHIHLQRGQNLFLIWIANLDGSSNPYTNPGHYDIGPKLTTEMTGTVFSPTSLARQLRELSAKTTELEKTVSFWTKVSWGLCILAIGLIARYMIFYPLEMPPVSDHLSSANQVRSLGGDVTNSRTEGQNTTESSPPVRID